MVQQQQLAVIAARNMPLPSHSNRLAPPPPSPLMQLQTKMAATAMVVVAGAVAEGRKRQSLKKVQHPEAVFF